MNELRRRERAGVFRAEHPARTKLITPTRWNPYFEPLERLATMFFATEALHAVNALVDSGRLGVY